MTPPSKLSRDVDVRARVLQVLAALEAAGVTPIANRDLHAIAYLSNVLSPMWEVEPLEGSVLKSEHGPRSTVFEQQLDSCVGQGLVTVVSLENDPESDQRLSASYRLAAHSARPVLSVINGFPDERRTRAFLDELAFAFAEIDPDERDDTALEDAAWTNPSVADNRVVDFAEFVEQARNPSFNVMQSLQRYAPKGVTYSPAEKLALYVRLLRKRAHG